MEQVTGSVGGEENGENKNHVTTNLFNDLAYDDQTFQILKAIKLDSRSAVFAGLFLLELYYNKIHNLSFENDTKNMSNGKNLYEYHKPNPLTIFVFGLEQNIIEFVDKITAQLKKINIFGQMKMYIEKKSINWIEKKFICFKWPNYSRTIKIWCVNCKNSSELMEYLDSGNEMMYWAHNTGLVISPFAKIGIETNQVVPNVKNLNQIPNQKLFELKLIGFEIGNYIKSLGFVRGVEPKFNLIDKEKEEILIGEINMTNIEAFLVDCKNTDQNNWTELDDHNQKLELLHWIGEKYLIHPKNKWNNSSIIFNGIFKQVLISKRDIYIVMTIPDIEVANKIKNIVKFCFDNCSKNNFKTNYSCLIDSKYLKSGQKYLSLQSYKFTNEKNKCKDGDFCPCGTTFAKPNVLTSLDGTVLKHANISDNTMLDNYSEESNMVILCKLNTHINILDATNKNVLNNEKYKDYEYYHNSMQFDVNTIITSIPTNTILNVWSVFGFYKCPSNNPTVTLNATFIMY